MTKQFPPTIRGSLPIPSQVCLTMQMTQKMSLLCVTNWLEKSKMLLNVYSRIWSSHRLAIRYKMAASTSPKELLKILVTATFRQEKNPPLIWYWIWSFSLNTILMPFTVLMNQKRICTPNCKAGYCESCIYLFRGNHSFGFQHTRLECFKRQRRSKRSIQEQLPS